jgi:hypothetical protein
VKLQFWLTPEAAEGLNELKGFMGAPSLAETIRGLISFGLTYKELEARNPSAQVSLAVTLPSGEVLDMPLRRMFKRQ